MALKSSGDLTTDEKINELVRGETNNEKRLLQDEFDRKVNLFHLIKQILYLLHDYF